MMQATTAEMVQGTIANRAMLVDLTITEWHAVKTDRKVAREVAVNHGTDEDMGRYHKNLLAKEALAEVVDMVREAHAKHRELTLAWSDGGVRILSAIGYVKYMKVMSDIKRRFYEAVARFVVNYPALYEEAKVKLNAAGANGLFVESDYPRPDRVGDKFTYNLKVMPLATAGDFRVDLGDEVIAVIKAQYEEDLRGLEAAAQGELVERVRVAVARMSERLHAYSKGPEGTTGNFHATLVTNIRDVAALIPTLNVNADPRLDELAARLEDELCQHEAADLKDSNIARQDTASKADAILASLSDFIS